MHWIETEPLPKACADCHEEDCYNCDTAGERWTLSAEDKARLLSLLRQQKPGSPNREE